MSLSPRETPTKRERKLIESPWRRFRTAIVDAGFEDFSTINDDVFHGFFIRPVPSLGLAEPEWSFLEELPLNRALRGGPLPMRSRQRPLRRGVSRSRAFPQAVRGASQKPNLHVPPESCRLPPGVPGEHQRRGLVVGGEDDGATHSACRPWFTSNETERTMPQAARKPFAE